MNWLNYCPDKWQNYKNNFEEFIIKAVLNQTLHHSKLHRYIHTNHTPTHKNLLYIWWSCPYITQAFTTVNLNETTITIHNSLENSDCFNFLKYNRGNETSWITVLHKQPLYLKEILLKSHNHLNKLLYRIERTKLTYPL